MTRFHGRRIQSVFFSLAILAGMFSPCRAAERWGLPSRGENVSLRLGASAAGLPMPAAVHLSLPARPVALARVIETKAGYNAVRGVLRTMALEWGLGYSLPIAGEALAEEVMEEAARRRFLVIDRDDTLARNVDPMTLEQAAPLLEGLRNGKVPIVATDRPADSMPNDPGNSAFEKMTPLLVPEAAGMAIGTNRGGRVYILDQYGRPQLVHEEPPFSPEQNQFIKEAMDAVVQALPKLGTGLYPAKGSDLEPHSASILLQVGTPFEIVQEVAALFQEELASRGIRHEVAAKTPNNPEQPPYISFSKVSKASVLAWAVEKYGMRAEEAVGVGDGMMAPIHAKADWSLARLEAAQLGRFLSGRDALFKGSGTDANMELGLPGMMMLSVGLTAGPLLDNAWVLPRFGPEMTAQFLKKWARRTP